MLLALLLAVNLADWVPARWPSNDPKSLELVAETPINCLLVEQPTAGFVEAATERGIAVLAVVRAGAGGVPGGLAGVVVEGRAAGFSASDDFQVIELPARAEMRFDAPVVGTSQGIWPGVHVETKAAATGGPWIDTNSGFLRFVRAATSAPVWIGVRPPPGRVLKAEDYLHAICDAGFVGARWIVALDDDFQRRLLAREATALRDWRRMAAQLRFLDEHNEARTWPPHGQLALVQDAAAGGLFSGGILDMIATKHTPVRPVPLPKLSPEALAGSRMAVNVDPASLDAGQKEALRTFTRGGGTLLNGPPGWKLPAARTDKITLDEAELKQIDDIWKEINSMIGRSNLGARLFNVAGMLSNLVGEPDGKRVVLYLVNYTSYPVENVTVHLLGNYTRARLETPAAPPRELETYPVEDATGVDIPQIAVSAALVLEK
jgi:hypothetical protein